MSSQPSSARVARALLRLSTSLAGHVDPLEGGDERAMGRLAEELREVLEDAQGTLDPDVVRLLSSAKSTLASPDSFIPPASCTGALSAIASGLHLVVSSASPPRPPPFSRLPAELVARIVELCQSDDLRLRQNTNLALSATCRVLYAAVRPTLIREMHLFTASQVEGAAKALSSGERDADAVRELTADLKLADLELQPNGRWAGRHFLPLVALLDKLDKLHVSFTPADPSREEADEVERALGLVDAHTEDSEWHSLPYKPMVRDLRLPLPRPGLASTTLALSYHSPGPLERLYIGDTARPQLGLDDLVDWARDVLPEAVKRKPPPLKVLAIPFVPITASELLDIVRPPHLDDTTVPPCRLEDLEVLLNIDSNIPDAVKNVQALFEALAPTLRRLVLRVVFIDGLEYPDDRRFVSALCAALAQCETLEYLEMGGIELWCDWPIALGEDHPPNLRTIVFLPHTYPGALIDYAESRPRTVRQATLCLPAVEKFDHWRQNTMEYVRGALEVCEEHGLEVRLEVREAEGEWWELWNGEEV
ncbi:hypothetical protein JCM10213_000381 [Rhodosporidiobolus nylandii]